MIYSKGSGKLSMSTKLRIEDFMDIEILEKTLI